MSLPPGPEFDELRAEYRQGMVAKLAALDAQWAQAVTGDAGAHEALVRALHTIAGSAGTFGLPAIGVAARAAENFLEEKGAKLGGEDRQRFVLLLEELRANALSNE